MYASCGRRLHRGGHSLSGHGRCPLLPSTATAWCRVGASAAVTDKRDGFADRKKERRVSRWPSPLQEESGLQRSRARKPHAEAEGHGRVLFFPLLHAGRQPKAMACMPEDSLLRKGLKSEGSTLILVRSNQIKASAAS